MISVFRKNFKWLLILLSSCISLSKEEQQRDLLSLPTLDSSVEESVKSSFFSEGDWPSEHWWEMFASEQLGTCIERAIAHNPSLLAVRKKIEFAAQTAKVVRSRLFPLISFDADETWQLLSKNGLYRALNPTIPLNANLVDLTLSFTYEFDFWGKNRNLFHAALGERKAEEAEAAQVELITTTAVAQTFFALKTNLVRKKLYQMLYQIRKETFELQQLLMENALFSLLPPLLSQEDLLESQKLVIEIEAEVETNRHLLNVLMGVGPDAPVEVDEQLPPLPEQLQIPRTLSIDLLARRPDLMAQIWRVEALANQVGAAKADFYPNINLTGFLGLESIFYSILFQGHSKAMGLSPAIHLPIFTAGAIRANVRAKKALFDQAVESYNQLLLQSTQEVADLLVFARSLYSQKQDQEKIVENAKLRWDVTALRNEKGLDSFFEIYAKQEEWIYKELDNITLLYGQYAAAIKLTKALGGGYQSGYSIPLKAEVAADE